MLLNWNLWPLNCTTWWYFSEVSGVWWEQLQKKKEKKKREQLVCHSVALALHQQTGLTWQHSFCHLMASKWADTAHLWPAPLWHFIHWWQFVYSGTVMSPQMLWPHCYQSWSSDCVNSYCKTMHSEVRFILQLCVYPFFIFYFYLPLSSHLPLLFWQTVFSCFIQSSLVHPSIPFSPGGLFMLGLAANTQAERHRSTNTHPAPSGHAEQAERPHKRAITKMGLFLIILFISLRNKKRSSGNNVSGKE